MKNIPAQIQLIMTTTEETHEYNEEQDKPASKIKDIRTLYIATAVLLSPCILYKIFDFIPVSNFVIHSTIEMISGLIYDCIVTLIYSRMYYIPYVFFAILTATYILALKKEEPPKHEHRLFAILLVIHITELIQLEIMYRMTMVR
jgi:hypothetical protein